MAHLVCGQCMRLETLDEMEMVDLLELCMFRNHMHHY